MERPTTSRATGKVKDSLKLPKLGDEDDIEAYLTTFERMHDGCVRGGEGEVDIQVGPCAGPCRISDSYVLKHRSPILEIIKGHRS